MPRKTPSCSRCGQEHYNFSACPTPRAPQQPVRVLWRHEPDDGFRVSSGWGARTKGVPVIYSLPARLRNGSLVDADGTNHVPPVLPDAA